MRQSTVYLKFGSILTTQKVRKWGVSVFFFIVTLVFSLLYHWSAPVADHWYIMKLYTKLQDGTLAFSDLFELHGAHWHSSGYVVQLALAEITAMAHWAESLASVLFAAFGFLALARMLDRCMGQLHLRQATLWVYGLSAFLYFSLDQAANWLWGWQVAVFISNAGALWAIERLTKGTPTLLNTALAAVATATSVYSLGTNSNRVCSLDSVWSASIQSGIWFPCALVCFVRAFIVSFFLGVFRHGFGVYQRGHP